ncbi:hypothetical protein HDR60_03450 [bacterium]|nr:hypothetical protein [bacterium]
MRLSHRILVTILALYPVYTQDCFSASRTGSSKNSNSRRLTGGTSIEETKQDCITKYIAALDLECYNSNNTNKGGVYSDCSDRTIVDLYDVMDMQLANVVPYKDLSKYIKNCPSYKGEAVATWLGAKNTIEQSAVKSSGECLYATDRLNAAKKCYSAALAHDGNFFDFENLMKSTCGTFPDIALKFAKAGDLGLSNIPKMLENYSTLQFTNKSENWRNAVEAVFAGYIYEAREACGEENYDIVQLNNFDSDSRKNLLTIANEGFASQFGEQLGSRTENLLSTGKPTVGYIASAKPTQALYSDTTVGKTVAKFYENMGWKNAIITGESGKSAKNNNKFGNTTPQIKNLYSVNNVYIIDNVSNLNTAKARLTNIIKNGDMGTAITQDSLDQTIANALGARSLNDASIYSILTDLEDGDTFIIKDKKTMCLVLTIKNDTLVKLSNSDVDNLPELYSYMNGCSDISE